MNNEVNVVESLRNMNARESEELQEYLFGCLDKGKNIHLINCANVKKIDGLGINTICYFIERGMHINLFNVHSEVRGILKLSGKESLINIIRGSGIDEVVSLLENEMLEEKGLMGDTERRRLQTRVSTYFPAKFKYYNDTKEVVNATADIVDLSERGMQMSQIKISGDLTGGYGDHSYIKGLDLHDIKYELNGSSEVVEASGVCVWESNRVDNLSAGIHFKEMSNKGKNRILKYVNKSVNIDE